METILNGKPEWKSSSKITRHRLDFKQMKYDIRVWRMRKNSSGTR
jgi:hypothetical protein